MTPPRRRVVRGAQPIRRDRQPGGGYSRRRSGPATGGVEKKEEEEMDGNPFGFLVLYGVSAVPIFITIAALSIMFVNSRSEHGAGTRASAARV